MTHLINCNGLFMEWDFLSENWHFMAENDVKSFETKSFETFDRFKILASFLAMKHKKCGIFFINLERIYCVFSIFKQ